MIMASSSTRVKSLKSFSSKYLETLLALDFVFLTFLEYKIFSLKKTFIENLE